MAFPRVISLTFLCLAFSVYAFAAEQLGPTVQESFIKTYGALCLSLFAILQVWVYGLWKRYFRKGQVEVYETGLIEVGYSLFGPTIGLNGTLRALHHDVFIRTIELTLTRESDGATHTFTWLAFRPPIINLTATPPDRMEIPSSFMLSASSPYRYNIIFNDSDVGETVTRINENYLNAWNRVLERLRQLAPSAIFQDAVNREAGNVINEFSGTPDSVTAFVGLGRACYWEPGNYRLAMTVRATRPNRFYTATYQFSLTAAECDRLRLNVSVIMNVPISIYWQAANWPFNFAYTRYLSN